MPCSPVSEPPSSTQAARIASASDLRALDLAFRRRVVEHEGVEVAVARVEDVADPQAVLRRQLVDSPKHRREPRARHDAVLHVVVGGDAAHRREGALAPEPQERPLVRVAGRADLERTCGAADRLHRRRVLLHLGRDAVQLDEEHGAGPSGYPGR